MAKVTIYEVSGENDLLHIYPRQQQPQGCYLELDCRSGGLSAEYNPEIGNAVPFAVWHGHTQRFGIVPLSKADANELLHEVEAAAQRVCDGYRSEWDGNNMVAVFDDDALGAMQEIQASCDACDGQALIWADARDWLYDVKRDIASALAAGSSIDELMEEYDGDGMVEDQPVLVGLRDYLEGLAERVAAGETDI